MRCSWQIKSTCAFKVICTGISLIISFMISVSICAAEGEWITCKEGVSLWNSQPVSNESCSWTGGVNDEKKAHGTGVVVWFQNGAIIQVTIMERDNGQIKNIFKIIEKDGTIKDVTSEPTPSPECENQCVTKCVTEVRRELKICKDNLMRRSPYLEQKTIINIGQACDKKARDDASNCSQQCYNQCK